MAALKPVVVSIEERNELVVQFRHLPRRVYRMYAHIPAVRGLGADDAIAEGHLGLIRAAELYDRSKGWKFVTFAYPWVRQSIFRAAVAFLFPRIPDRLFWKVRKAHAKANRDESSRKFLETHRFLKRVPLPEEDGEQMGVLGVTYDECAEEYSDLYAAIDQLCPRRRDVVLMHLAGLSGREIASQLGVCAAAVSARLQVAYRELRQLLPPY